MEAEESEYNLGSSIQLTWKNVMLIIVIFYIIGDILLGVRMYVNKQIKEYQVEQNRISSELFLKEFDNVKIKEEQTPKQRKEQFEKEWYESNKK
jgi:predicted negative regulator of RcsB-dependent stress response